MSSSLASPLRASPRAKILASMRGRGFPRVQASFSEPLNVDVDVDVDLRSIASLGTEAEADPALAPVPSLPSPSHSCRFCRYPCKSAPAADATEPCKVAAYLEDWQDENDEKPFGFDRNYYSKHASGFETAVVSFGGRQGSFWKSENQDAFFVVPIHDGNEGTNPQYALGVFDGHGQNGGVASKVASRAFAKKIESFVKMDGGRLLSERKLNERLVEILFEHTEAAMDAYPADFEKSGTTAVVCVVSPDMVTGGWVGDSRAVVGPQTDESAATKATRKTTNVVAIPLTKDHKPDPIRNPKEAARIAEVGGRVDRLTIDQQGRPVGPYRVFLQDRWVPGLAVSRAFGDYIAREAGVIAKPDINSLAMSGDRGSKRVVILGTDGLWEWISNEDAMRVVWSMPNAHEAANALAEAAIKNWAMYSRGTVCDDVTVAVVFV